MIFNFALFLIWTSMAVMVLVIGPFFAPNLIPEWVKNKPFVGYTLLVLGLWNFVRWWSVRSYRQQREREALMEEAYYLRTNPPNPADNTKPIVHPEFKFDDSSSNSPPPSPPNGASH